ncbi:hypothetical protein [Nocardia noduli]|uniref:hypothetical protein n=1 Tax=Nocardia noduli TaxID=2815722 RepID=UPI001C2288E0|nr:hypothetical protein [Nocardia noduli]
MTGTWQPGPGMEFDRVAVVVDRGRIREYCEVFARYRPDSPFGAGAVELTLHREAGFVAVAHLVMSLDDAAAVLAVLAYAVGDACDLTGRDVPEVSPFQVRGSGAMS